MLQAMAVWVFMMAVIIDGLGLPQVSCLQPTLPFEAAGPVSLAGEAAAAAAAAPYQPLCQATKRVALLEFASSGFNGVTCDNSGFIISLLLYLPPYYTEDQELHFNASPLAKLQSLQALELGNIDFDSSAIALFSSTLTSLIVQESPLRSPIPWAALAAKLFRLTTLQVYNLPAQRLDGNMLAPELCNLTRLETLTISSIDGLRGSIPSCLSKLPWLVSLDLSNNHLEGLILQHWNATSPLQRLDLSSNFLMGFIDPSLLGWNRVYVDVGNNLTGSMPHSLGNSTKLIKLSMANNQLSGEIPEEWGNLYNLKELDLSRNHLMGKIPASMGQMGRNSSLVYPALGNPPLNKSAERRHPLGALAMRGCSTGTGFCLDLHSNELSGEIPWVNLLSFDYDLVYWNFADNRLTRELPDQEKVLWVGGVPMISLKLDHNSLSGNLPDEFDNDGCLDLVSVVLSHNHLTGPIPPSLRNLSSSLVVLDLSHNHLEGWLPQWIQQMHSLRVLSIGFNSFSGPLPSTIWNCTKLQVLDLSNNNLSGRISRQSFSHLQGFAYSSVWETQVNTSLTLYDEILTIHGKGLDLKFTYLLTATVSLDLSNNALHGPIPPQLGSLDGLIFLGLSSNHLTGLIPEELGRLKQLNSMDLASNELEGEIPQALCSLTFLSYGDVSRNRLRGPIPECKQWGDLLPQLLHGQPRLIQIRPPS
ncbi:hypothetical protein GOP47_0013367 [Adiantum capillus-veneris]|uniref:Uncharacterized protein n=1 Tax=Adiantum capillus-veneris TaxID=13818 RepID=A0A9D4UP28_ADICA|nr:hypothetical protein GOP47_0013367 [Adiantum capillus-veneris]